MNKFVQDINPSCFSKHCQELRCGRGYTWNHASKRYIHFIVRIKSSRRYHKPKCGQVSLLVTQVLHLPATSKISPNKTHRKGRRMSQEECWVHNKPRSWGNLSLFTLEWEREDVTNFADFNSATVWGKRMEKSVNDGWKNCSDFSSFSVCLFIFVFGLGCSLLWNTGYQDTFLGAFLTWHIHLSHRSIRYKYLALCFWKHFSEIRW